MAITMEDAHHSVDPVLPQPMDLRRTSSASAIALMATSVAQSATKRCGRVPPPTVRESARNTSSGSSDVTRWAANHEAKSAAAIPAVPTRASDRGSTSSRSTGKRS